MSAAALLSSKWEDLLKTMKRVSKYKWYRIFITQNWCDFRYIYIYCELTSILANHFNSHFTIIQMVYNQALLNNLYHDIKKYKDIKVLVEGGEEAQTYEFIMYVHGMKRRFTWKCVLPLSWALCILWTFVGGVFGWEGGRDDCQNTKRSGRMGLPESH